MGINYNDHEYEIFKDLNSVSMLVSLESGIVYQPKTVPLITNLSMGYTLHTKRQCRSGVYGTPFMF